MRKKTYCLLTMVFTIIVTIFISSCNAKSQEEQRGDKYLIKPSHDIVLYGLNINKVINKTFAEIAREVDAKVEADPEVAVIFINKKKDFVLKSQQTSIKDYILIQYGPIDDLATHKNLGKEMPNTILFYGALKLNENTITKKTIQEELAKNLPQNSTTKEIIEKIEHMFVTGAYREGQKVTITFDSPDFAVAYCSIFFYREQLHYKYVFSKTKEIYPEV